MTKQDMRLRNRRVKRQALITRRRILASINHRILKPIFREIRRESSLDEASVLGIINAVFMQADLVARVKDIRLQRNLADINAYSMNYLNEVNKVYAKEKKKREANES